MTTKQKTIVVTGASQGIGAAVANLFLDRDYNVVGNSRKISDKNELQRSDKLPAHTVTPRADFGRQGHRRGRVLSHRGEPGHRRGAAR